VFKFKSGASGKLRMEEEKQRNENNEKMDKIEVDEEGEVKGEVEEVVMHDVEHSMFNFYPMVRKIKIDLHMGKLDGEYDSWFESKKKSYLVKPSQRLTDTGPAD